MGAFSVASRFLVTAMSSSSEVSGGCAARTLKPFFWRSGITLLHDEPSAHAPCTSTTFVFGSILVLLFVLALFTFQTGPSLLPLVRACRRRLSVPRHPRPYERRALLH